MNVKQSVPLRLKEIRNRADVTMAEAAKYLGFKGASGYQHYEDPNKFTQEFLPVGIAKKILPLLEGKGTPPVTESEIMDLAGAPPFKLLRQIEADFKLIPLDRQKEAADLISLALQAFKTPPRK